MVPIKLHSDSEPTSLPSFPLMLHAA